MAITNILQGAEITVSATPQKLFTTNAQNRLSYRIFVPRVSPVAVLVMALPAGSSAPTQATMLAKADFSVAPGSTLEDNIPNTFDIWIVSETSGTVTITGKEIIS